MVYTDKNAAYALNSYTRKLLQVNLGWNKADYGGPDFLIPVAQQPELLQTGRPFLVYGSARHPSDHLYQHVKEAVSYTIYATSSTEVNKVANLLAETYARQDDAARDVNEWLATEAEHRTNGHRGVFFTSVRTVMAEKADPSEEEGGYVSAIVMLECRYTEESESNIVTSGFTYP